LLNFFSEFQSIRILRTLKTKTIPFVVDIKIQNL